MTVFTPNVLKALKRLHRTRTAWLHKTHAMALNTAYIALLPASSSVAQAFE